jgi:hypothetical protein
MRVRDEDRQQNQCPAQAAFARVCCVVGDPAARRRESGPMFDKKPALAPVPGVVVLAGNPPGAHDPMFIAAGPKQHASGLIRVLRQRAER